LKVLEDISQTNGYSRAESGAAGTNSYSGHVNPQWVRLLELLQMNVCYTRCQGVELDTANGDRILDFLSGYCVHNVGHNHPKIVAALHHELDRCGPAMLQSHVAGLAGELAEKLCNLAGGRLNKAYFCSSGSEGIETAGRVCSIAAERFTASPAEHCHSWRTPPGPKVLVLFFRIAIVFHSMT
jgi:4-aminobutyrate aminotransferase-like enzyme